MSAVFWKELADHFSRRRFLVLLGIVVFAAMWAVYVTVRSIRGVAGSLPSELIFLQMFTTGGGVLPPFIFFLSFFGPLIGVVLGFDSINAERTQGTLARTLAQPIYRDTLFNGKFLAALATIVILVVSIVLIVTGMGMYILGVPPSFEAVLRILLFTVATIVYMAFWLALSMLCSVWFNRGVTSALTALALWLFFGFIILMVAGAIADLAVPQSDQQEDAVRRAQTQEMVQRISPVMLFEEATSTLLTPTARSLVPLQTSQAQLLDMQSPLAVTQSLLLVWPHLAAITALTALCFGISYVRFLREEVRA